MSGFSSFNGVGGMVHNELTEDSILERRAYSLLGRVFAMPVLVVGI